MSGMAFTEKLAAAVTRNESLLCVGLDPELELFPSHLQREPATIVEFNRAIIEATQDLVCCYKPNIAFYQRYGAEGWAALRATISSVPPHIPVLLDAKSGDVGNTMRAYADAAFLELKADAVTLAPWYGHDAIRPFLAYRDRGVFLVCRTSNAGGADFQDALIEGEPLYLRVARRAVEWNRPHGHIGLVVGATGPAQARAVRAAAPELAFLVPGLGAQGADLEAAVGAALRSDGAGILAAASRSILYAGSGPDYAGAARAEAQRLRAALNLARAAGVHTR
jgi:orotidine-5'-phosphate decarboxylase